MSGRAPYFPDKKSEINELRMLLRNPAIERDPGKKRDVLKRVISMMTQGIDCSRLFSEMTMAAHTDDFVVKKLVFLFLVRYSDSNHDISIMSINTLLRACQDENPQVRGLGLRSLCSLRLPNISEYLLAPLQAALKDIHPYVRKVAVVGCLKLFYLSPRALSTNGIVDKLYEMLRDRDALVVANVISVLDEIEEDGCTVAKGTVHHLLNRIKEFNEWSQCVVLELVSRYQPGDDEDEVFDIMNLLEPLLKHSNSAVVLATTKIFLHLTQGMPDVHVQVYERIKTPLLTMMSAGAEVGFACLHHIALLVQRAPQVFEEDYKSFFCRFNDPSYVKALKLDVLTAIASDANALTIVEELGEYVTDVNVDIARRSIRASSRIAIDHPSVSEAILSEMLKLVDLQIDYVSAETLICLADVLRKYPEHHEDACALLPRTLGSIDEPEARVAMIWMLGEFGEHLDEAPYLLEPIVDQFSDESAQVKMQLLTTTMKLFFKRPPEVHAALGRLLSVATLDSSHQDAHDRAMLYYRLLAEDVDEAGRVVNCEKDPILSFAESGESEAKEKVFDEFNTLSVVYGMPSERFIVRKTLEEEIENREQLAREEMRARAPSAAEAAATAAGATGAGGDDDDDEPEEAQEGLLTGATAADLVDFGGNASANAALVLDASAVVEPATFQQKWGSAAGETLQFTLGKSPESVEGILGARSVRCIASGSAGGKFKGYFYGTAAGVLVMAEVIADLATLQAQVTARSENPALVKPFLQIISTQLA